MGCPVCPIGGLVTLPVDTLWLCAQLDESTSDTEASRRRQLCCRLLAQ